jgi:hypothetical protein
MVTYGPGVGFMLASNADRERAADVLRAGFAEGRLTQPEFTERMARVQSARTYDQLAELTRDLPAGPWAAGTPPIPHQDRVTYPFEPTFVNLALTAAVVFTLAAIVTALAFFAHVHGQSVPAPTYLQAHVRTIR